MFTPNVNWIKFCRGILGSCVSVGEKLEGGESIFFHEP